MTKVVTIGLGYIGLPTSALIASKGIKVNGVDINNDIVNTINSGRIHIVEPDLENIVKDSVNKKMLFASTKPETGDVYLIVVPTPFKGNHEPDISYIKEAVTKIIPVLTEESIVIFKKNLFHLLSKHTFHNFYQHLELFRNLKHLSFQLIFDHVILVLNQLREIDLSNYRILEPLLNSMIFQGQNATLSTFFSRCSRVSSSFLLYVLQ